MLSPDSLNVGLEHGAKWAIIIQARDTTVDLEGGHIEELLTEKIFALLALVLLGQVFDDSGTSASGLSLKVIRVLNHTLVA